MFFGALNREKDWQRLMPVINAVAAEAGDRLKFQVVHDQSFFSALDTQHKTFTPTCDYDTYLDPGRVRSVLHASGGYGVQPSKV
jgi:hypothetical protein